MKKILLILTGGTFGMQESVSKVLKVSEIENQLYKIVPEIKSIAEVEIFSAFNIDSSDIDPSHWEVLARKIEESISDFDGFVIIHGTDTMAYTASALSFMLNNLNKPVILTGSQRPLKEIRNDARTNLINSLELACYSIPEVMVCFDNRLFRGNRVKKIDISDYDAFSSPNFPVLADVGIDIKISDYILKRHGIFSCQTKFDCSLTSIPMFPGLKSDNLNYLADSNLKAIIFEAYGAGNIPVMNHSMIDLIEELVSRNKIVAIKSQCVYGKINLGLYSGGKEALHAGAISCMDMTREASIVKMMFLLAQYKKNKTIKEHFNKAIAGELT